VSLENDGMAKDHCAALGRMSGGLSIFGLFLGGGLCCCEVGVSQVAFIFFMVSRRVVCGLSCTFEFKLGVLCCCIATVVLSTVALHKTAQGRGGQELLSLFLSWVRTQWWSGLVRTVVQMQMLNVA